MWSLSLLKTPDAEKRGNRELARYVRLEYGTSDIDWFTAVLNEAHQSPSVRIKAWLRRRVDRKEKHHRGPTRWLSARPYYMAKRPSDDDRSRRARADTACSKTTTSSKA